LIFLFIKIVEKKFSNVELNNISSMIEQIKTRLNFFEGPNFLLRDDPDKLQDKSTEFSEITNELDVRNYFVII
jgi:hypothetical protein